MRVRAVAAVAAFAVWCASGAAVAAGYAEVWNPPEANGHVAGPAKKNAAKMKAESGVGSKAGSKAFSTRASSHRATATEHSGHPAAHGSANQAVGKGVTTSAVNAARQGKDRPKAPALAQIKKPHAHLVQDRPAQAKAARANLVVPSADTAHQPRPQKPLLAAKTGATKTGASHADLPASSANVSAAVGSSTSDPATASSGSLPPILH